MKIAKVWFDKENVYIQTDVGHIVGNPLSWFPRLLKATPEQRNRFRFDDDSIRWDEIDEDLCLEGFFTYKVNLQHFDYSE